MTGESLQALQQAVAAGDTDAMVRLGVRYLTGHDTPPRPALGADLIEQAAGTHPDGAFIAATLAASGLWRARYWDAALDHLARSARLGHAAAQSLLQVLAGGPTGREVTGEDWDRLRDAVDLSTWIAPRPLRPVRATPRIFAVDHFAPPAACAWLREQARARLVRATIYDRASGGDTEDERRTNSQCDLDVVNGGILTFLLRARIAALVGRPEAALEVPKILHYAPGETFAEHHDFLDPRAPAYAAELAARGQRMATFLIYLNDDYTGGETSFPRIGLMHRARRGDALLFSNIKDNGAPDPDTLHAGLPPATGEKWVFSQWIRSLPAR